MCSRWDAAGRAVAGSAANYDSVDGTWVVNARAPDEPVGRFGFTVPAGRILEWVLFDGFDWTDQFAAQADGRTYILTTDGDHRQPGPGRHHPDAAGRMTDRRAVVGLVLIVMGGLLYVSRSKQDGEAPDGRLSLARIGELAARAIAATGAPSPVDKRMIAAMVEIESGRRPAARRYEAHLGESSLGLMQVTPVHGGGPLQQGLHGGREAHGGPAAHSLGLDLLRDGICGLAGPLRRQGARR